MATSSKYAVKRSYCFGGGFSSFVRRYEVALIETDNRKLLDGDLAFWLNPTQFAAVAAHLMTGPDSVRVWLNEHDVTPEVLAAVIKRMAARPAADLRKEYLSGVDETLAVLEMAGAALGVDVAAQRALANTHANAGIASLMTKLGDRTVGWSGLLHPALYLFRYIRLKPISLLELWNQFQQRTGVVNPTDLAGLALRSVVFTQAWPLNPGQPDYKTGARGGVSGSLELAHENPIRPFIEEVATRLRELDKRLEDLRVNYLDPTADLVRQTAVDAKAGLQGCDDALRDIETIVKQIRP